MKLIISPAKKMVAKEDFIPWQDLPVFLENARVLMDYIRSLSLSQAKALWSCNESLAGLNYRRFQEMDLEHNLTPAILAYEGIQYQYMAPQVFEQTSLDYVQEHLRILSGFYGLLRPFDGVTPYRLEMGAKLAVDGKKDLYGFWGDTLAQALCRETDLIVNLASREYSRAIAPHLPERVAFLTCVFGEEQNGRVIEKGTLCKMARGEMVRYLAQCRGEDPEALRAFDRLGYRFRPDHSDEKTYVFIKE